jgi:hypothetical protein
MRLLLSVLFVSLLLPLPAQGAAADQVPNLVVSSFYWGRIDKTFVDPSTPGGVSSVRPRRRRRGMPPPLVLLRRETYALVRNKGTRTVKAVTWNYIFYNDEKHEQEAQRFQFRTKETIPPGEMKFLTESVSDDAPTAFGEVVIERVEYEDGTTWQRTPGAE